MTFLLPIRCILFIISFVGISIITHKNFLDISKWWTLILNICNIITIIILFHIYKKKNIRFPDLVNNKSKQKNIREIFTWSIIIFLVGLLGMYVIGFIIYNQIPYTPEIIMQPIPIILAVLNIFILPLTTTIAEEGLYLGLGVNQINNKYKAIIIPTFFYALQHSFLPMILDYKYIIYRFCSFIPVILLMCIYFYKKRKLIPVMAGHYVINLATVIQILIISI